MLLCGEPYETRGALDDDSELPPLPTGVWSWNWTKFVDADWVETGWKCTEVLMSAPMVGGASAVAGCGVGPEGTDSGSGARADSP